MHFLGLIKLNFNFSNPKNDFLSVSVSEPRVQKIDFTQQPEEANLARLEEALYADDDQGICNLSLYC
ncbi:hypothetical protein STA3757_08530 [Stanieria sp. NIES-3757]|nr:hypothetical protein STA3757_08530 [Stanieria sp. NIES-3757]